MLYRPTLFRYGRTPSTPSAAIAWGVLATGKSLRVAALTLRSVVWAESITATRSSNGERVQKLRRRVRIGRLQAPENGSTARGLHAWSPR